jgi:Histidine kinase-, DNA gyrase B-, and HSP90-like ATPase
VNPQIEFKHVLGELSVNRNDPCEVLRELISNSYDANAHQIAYFPLQDRQGIAFLDDGTGLDHRVKINGITPWEAFFSIGKSTKKQGDSIGYKCQGSKLCFACARIMVATTSNRTAGKWTFKIIDNPRTNLDVNFDISPDQSGDINSVLDNFYAGCNADTAASINQLKQLLAGTKLKETNTLILIDTLETEGYAKYFSVGPVAEESYVYNYIRFYTRHGDVRHITASQGFTANQRNQVAASVRGAAFTVFSGSHTSNIPFGYPYLDQGTTDPNLKSPAEVARLRDGRFFSRAAKRFLIGASKFSIVVAIDGNRRAHDEYKYLARKGKAQSGIRLSDQRGVFISVKGIKICKYPELLSAIPGYEVLSEGDAASHYCLILDGDFDLVTNRSALSKRAYDTLTDSTFLAEVKKFLDALKASDSTFSGLLSRLRKESTEVLLNEQIELLEAARAEVKNRERIRFLDGSKQEHLFLSPRAGEEYLVGVLYSQLSTMAGKAKGFEKYWRRVITFSTQGIDSLGLRDEMAAQPLAEKNICSIEYKFEFHNNGPFNHALAVVDFIVAWSVNVDLSKQVKDAFTCFGNIEKVAGNNFEWEISNIENIEGGTYPHKITVIDLRELLKQTFNPKFTPSAM